MKIHARLCLAILSLGILGSNLVAQQAPEAQSNEQGLASKVDAESDANVFAALVFASHEKANVPAISTKLRPELLEKLKKKFNYEHFEVLGMQDDARVLRAYESWIVPSKDLFLKVDSKGVQPNGGLNLHLQLWQEKNVLIKTDLLLQKSSPLFIGGPHWRKGQLIFVLELK